MGAERNILLIMILTKQEDGQQRMDLPTREIIEKLKSFLMRPHLHTLPYLGIETNKYYILNRNRLDWFGDDFLNTQPYLQSEKAQIVVNGKEATINFEINATAPEANLIEAGLTRVGASVNYAIFAENDSEILVLDKNSKFVPLTNDRDNLRRMYFPSNNSVLDDVEALTESQSHKGILSIDVGISF